MAQQKWIWLGTMRLQFWSLASLSELRSHIAVNCGVSCRRGLDPTLLWLWRRPASAAPIQSLAWESPYVSGAALQSKKKKKGEQVQAGTYQRKLEPIRTYLNLLSISLLQPGQNGCSIGETAPSALSIMVPSTHLVQERSWESIQVKRKQLQTHLLSVKWSKSVDKCQGIQRTKHLPQTYKTKNHYKTWLLLHFSSPNLIKCISYCSL